jgi:hypothetical protein
MHTVTHVWIFQVNRSAADMGKNSPKDRLRRAGFFASRLQDGDAMLGGHGKGSEDATMKQLETQHWLELIDGFVAQIN